MQHPALSQRLKRTATLICLIVACGVASSDPEDDRRTLRTIYGKRFPHITVDQFAHGVYATDPALAEQWQALDDFPPYSFLLDEGSEAFQAPLQDGAHYADCFTQPPAEIATQFPRFDDTRKEIETLAMAINRCRRAHGDARLRLDGGTLLAVQAYLGWLARGERLAIPDPLSPSARAHYETGRRLFYSKRGQRNFSCADCHVTAAGQRLREQILAPLLGAVNHHPVYGLSWEGFGSLHRRFAGCLEYSGAAPWASQSPEYRALEYFLALLGRGLPIATPGINP